VSVCAVWHAVACGWAATGVRAGLRIPRIRDPTRVSPGQRAKRRKSTATGPRTHSQKAQAHVPKKGRLFGPPSEIAPTLFRLPWSTHPFSKAPYYGTIVRVWSTGCPEGVIPTRAMTCSGSRARYRGSRRAHATAHRTPLHTGHGAISTQAQRPDVTRDGSRAGSAPLQRAQVRSP
jgi:hypothetical protein